LPDLSRQSRQTLLSSSAFASARSETAEARAAGAASGRPDAGAAAAEKAGRKSSDLPEPGRNVAFAARSIKMNGVLYYGGGNKATNSGVRPAGMPARRPERHAAAGPVA